MNTTLEPFTVSVPEAGHTLAKILRSRLHESLPSWSQVHKLIESRRVTVGDAVCTDLARRLKEGERVAIGKAGRKLPRMATAEGLVIRHLDDQIVVVEKPAGVNSVRHPSELEWSDERRQLSPTLQDLALWAVAYEVKRAPGSMAPLRIVHRLDRETSGLLVFARTSVAERALGLQFKNHTVIRRYLALVAGRMSARTIASFLVRDRGDGRRGSTNLPGVGKQATTHIAVEEHLPDYTLLSCRLETGRTHQIRIHLSEAGKPVCGDKVYSQPLFQPMIPDHSGVPRLALHALELGFAHPATGAAMHWTMPLPPDLGNVLARLRAAKPGTS